MRLGSLRSCSAISKPLSILRLMTCGESAAGSGRLAGRRDLASRALGWFASKRFGIRDEMYSVRRRKETLASATLGLPRAAIGLRRARSCGWTANGCDGAWIAAKSCPGQTQLGIKAVTPKRIRSTHIVHPHQRRPAFPPSRAACPVLHQPRC